MRLLTLILVGTIACAAVSCARVQSSHTVSPAAASFICPMHADVRGAAGEMCPKCGMALVEASTDYRPYALDIDIIPRALVAGRKGLVRFVVREPGSGRTVRDFAVVHERIFHLFIVSYDLQHFAHVHPEQQRDGALEVEIEVPRAGAYQLIADFVPAGAAPQLVQRSFVTAGFDGPLSSAARPTPDLASKTAGRTRVDLMVPEVTPGQDQLLTFQMYEAATGAPVTDLEPYLGATAHLLVVSSDLSIAFHSHPVAEVSQPRGPEVVFQVRFPRAGDYKMWAQFQREGQVLNAAFTVPVGFDNRTGRR